MGVFYLNHWRIDQLPVQIKNISSMYLKYVPDFSSINGYMHFPSKWTMNISSWIYLLVFSLHKLWFVESVLSWIWNCLKVRMRTKKVVITFIGIVFFAKFLGEIFTTFVHLEFGMLVLSDFKLSDMRKIFSETSVMGFNLRRKSLLFF